MASGSTAMTGVEAISNGVPAFKPPEWRNAQKTLTAMGPTLGTMFLGISFLAQRLQVVPDLARTPRPRCWPTSGTPCSARAAAGHLLFYVLQVATMLILVLAANTAFADFPRLANFHAGRQLPARGSSRREDTGWCSPTASSPSPAAAALLVVLFRADVTRLIPFYAIGVFTSFTLSQAGMAQAPPPPARAGWKARPR